MIKYYLKNCKNRESGDTSLCLWRKSSFIIDKDLEELEDSQLTNNFVLLERVKKLEILYYNISNNEWLKEWKTGPNDRSSTPSAVSIKIEFEIKQKTLVKKQIYVNLHQQFILPSVG